MSVAAVSPRRKVWLLAVGVLAVAVGVNLGTPAVAGAALKGYLRSQLPGSSVEVDLQASPPIALWWGRAAMVTVAAHNVQMGTLGMERFDASFDTLRFDPQALYVHRTLVIRSLRSGSARATVTQEDLTRALAHSPAIRVDSVVLQPGRVWVRGAIRALGAELPAEGLGRLVLNGETAVDLILDSVVVAGGSLPGSVNGEAITIRSALEVPPLPFGFRLTGLRMENGRLVLDAGTGPV